MIYEPIEIEDKDYMIPRSGRFDDCVASKKQRKNWDHLTRIDKAAKKKGEILYRYITHQVGDGQAVYQIVYLTQRTARIRHVRGIGDDWMLPAWGHECSIPLRLVRQFIERRDNLARIFG